MNEIYPAKTKFWEPNIGDTFLSFLEFVKEKRKIKDPYDLQIIQNIIPIEEIFEVSKISIEIAAMLRQ